MGGRGRDEVRYQQSLTQTGASDAYLDWHLLLKILRSTFFAKGMARERYMCRHVFPFSLFTLLYSSKVNIISWKKHTFIVYCYSPLVMTFFLFVYVFTRVFQACGRRQ